MKLSLLTIVLVGIVLRANGQVTGTLTISTAPDWTDVVLITSSLSSEASFASTNYNSYPRISATVWDHSGARVTYRTLLKFNLSSLPGNAFINSAVLKLFADPANPQGEFGIQGPQSNVINIQRLAQNWNATTVTWNTQPNTVGANIVFTGGTTGGNVSITVTSLMQAMVNSPTTNYGLRLSLDNENLIGRSRNYASMDHPDATLHPRLEITYSYTPTTYYCIKDGDWSDAIWNVFPTGTVGSALPLGAIANIRGHTVTLKSATKVYSVSVGATNGVPGVLVVDNAILTSAQQLSVSTDNNDNKIQIINNGSVLVTAGQ